MAVDSGPSPPGDGDGGEPNPSGGMDINELMSQLAAELGANTGSAAAASGGGGGSGEAGTATSESDAADQVGELLDGRGGLPCVKLYNAKSGQAAEVYLFGACVTSWSVRAHEERLWLSRAAVFDRSKAIRGGVPICFPQFGAGALPQHGFARTSDWRLKSIDPADNGDASRCVLALSSADLSREHAEAFPHDFEAEYQVTLNLKGLDCELRVKNTGQREMRFTCALHNYFRVQEIDKTRVFGFDGLEYMDKLDGNATRRESDSLPAGLPVDRGVDRVYKRAPEELALFDSPALLVVKVDKRGMPDCTLWNPFSDEFDAEWSKFVCVEPAAFHDGGVSLQPGETWTGGQQLSVE